MDTVSEEVFEKALDKIRELSTQSAKLVQAVNDKDTELFESQELAAALLEALQLCECELSMYSMLASQTNNPQGNNMIYLWELVIGWLIGKRNGWTPDTRVRLKEN